MNPVEDTEAMLNRVARLDRLYVEAGRDKPDHPMHGLYTGLHAEACERDDSDLSK